MNAWIDSLNALSATWLDLLLRASWQGGIALAVVWIISRFLPRIPASHKVWLWRLAFLKLLVAFVWFSPVALPILPQQTPAVPIGQSIATIVEAEVPTETATLATITETPRVVLHLRAWLFLAWSVAVLLCAIRVMRHWRDTRRLLRGSLPLENPEVEEIARSLSKRLRLRRHPSSSGSPTLSSPVLVGLFHPRIILPRDLSQSVSPSRLELMLAHELAHVRRKDLLWLWLFTFGEVLFFFHPLVWIARREWTLATEAACDDLALRATRQTPRDYGEMLVDLVAANSRNNVAPLLAVGMIENANTLKRRLKLMITTRTRLAKVGGIALLVITTLALVPWKLTAQSADPEAVAKLKEENAKLRQELDAMRRDAEKMRADGELRKGGDADRQNEAALQRAMAEVKAQVAEREQRQKEKFRDDHQRVMEEVQAQLQELRTQFTEDHPRVREKQARLETLEAIDTALGGATRDRKRRALLQQEIELVERQVEVVRKGVENRTESNAALDAAQRELLEVKLQMAKLSGSKDAARAELRQQLELAEGMLKEHKKLAEARLASPSDELALQREVLRIKRQLHELEASDSPNRASNGPRQP